MAEDKVDSQNIKMSNNNQEYNPDTEKLYDSCKKLSLGNTREGVLCRFVLDAAFSAFTSGMLYTLGMLDHDVEKRTEEQWLAEMKKEKSCSGSGLSRSEWNIRNEAVMKYVAAKYIEIMDNHTSFLKGSPMEGIDHLLVYTDCKN